MGHITNKEEAQQVRGENFSNALRRDVNLAEMNSREYEEAPWVTVAIYLAALERRVLELERG